MKKTGIIDRLKSWGPNIILLLILFDNVWRSYGTSQKFASIFSQLGGSSADIFLIMNLVFLVVMCLALVITPANLPKKQLEDLQTIGKMLLIIMVWLMTQLGDILAMISTSLSNDVLTMLTFIAWFGPVLAIFLLKMYTNHTAEEALYSWNGTSQKPRWGKITEIGRSPGKKEVIRYRIEELPVAESTSQFEVSLVKDEIGFCEICGQNLALIEYSRQLNPQGKLECIVCAKKRLQIAPKPPSALV